LKILLLEDDYNYRATIKEFLLSLNFEVEDYENGDEAYESMYDTNYDLLLLDVRVPGLSGYDFVKRIREQENNIPIILITSLTDINNLSIGYETGCNDYIRKPFELKELKYRILQTINKAHFSTNTNKLNLRNGFYLNLETYDLYNNETKINLTKTEKHTLLALSKRLNSYVTTAILMEEVWENKEILETDVRMCIKRIRDKTSKDFIKNSRGLGYIIESK